MKLLTYNTLSNRKFDLSTLMLLSDHESLNRSADSNQLTCLLVIAKVGCFCNLLVTVVIQVAEV